MRSVIFFIGIVAALGLSFVLVGFCAPIEQSSELSKEFECSKQELWDQLVNVGMYPKIKEDVFQVEVVSSENEELRWIEYSKLGATKELEVVEQVPGEKLIVKVTDPTLNLEKRRIYTLFGDQSTSILSVKEHTRVERLLLRSTLAISGKKQGIKKELDNLAQYLSL